MEARICFLGTSHLPPPPVAVSVLSPFTGITLGQELNSELIPESPSKSLNLGWSQGTWAQPCNLAGQGEGVKAVL